MDDSGQGDGEGDDRSYPKIAVRIDRKYIAIKHKDTTKTFSGNRDLREGMKYLSKLAGPETARMLFLVSDIWRSDETI